MRKTSFAIFLVAMTLHFPLEHFTGLPVKEAAVVLLLAALLPSFHRVTGGPALFFGYVALVLVAVGFSLAKLPWQDVLLASTSYLLAPVLVALSFRENTEETLKTAAAVVKGVGLIAAVAAAYQISKDPLLFGLYSGTSYEFFEGWGTKRASSLFRSPQVFAAWSVFSVIFLDIVDNRKRMAPTPAMWVIAAGGLLAGSFSVIAALGLYYLSKGVFRAPKMVMPALALIYVVGVVISISIPDFQGPTARASASIGITEIDTGHSHRVQTWLNALDNSTFFGNGIGSASTLIHGSERYNTESYLLSLLYEGGVPLLAAFLLLVAWLALSAFWQEKTIETLAAAGLVFAYAFIVHAFYAWSLVIVWVLLIGCAMRSEMFTTRPVSAIGSFQIKPIK